MLERIARSSQPGWSDVNGARLKERATPESWNLPRISPVKVPRPPAERRRFTGCPQLTAECHRARTEESRNEGTHASRCVRDPLTPPTLVGAMLEAKDFIVLSMGSIIGMMVADEMNDWPSSSFSVCPNWVYQVGANTKKMDCAMEVTLLNLVLMTAKLLETHSCGWHQDGEHHCFTNKFQMPVTVWTTKAQRPTAGRVLNVLNGSDNDEWILMDTSLAVAIRSDERWNVFGDSPHVFAVEDCNGGRVKQQ